jgi:hypothetical protein
MRRIDPVNLQEARLVGAALLGCVALSACHNRFITIGPRPAPVQETIPARPALSVDTRDWVGYRVQPGDTLGRLARCSGASMDQLTVGNALADPDALSVDQAVLIPRGHSCKQLEGPAQVSAAPPSTVPVCKPAKPPANLLSRARSQLDEATRRQEAADFDGALALAQQCSNALRPYALDHDADATRARCHAAAATAAAGLGRRELAIEEFRRAFAVDPKLELDPATASPRILELAQAARS